MDSKFNSGVIFLFQLALKWYLMLIYSSLFSLFNTTSHLLTFFRNSFLSSVNLLLKSSFMKMFLFLTLFAFYKANCYKTKLVLIFIMCQPQFYSSWFIDTIVLWAFVAFTLWIRSILIPFSILRVPLKSS